MKDKNLLLILLIVLAMLKISVSSSFAQDVDISSMDNTQLMSLLQTIMQKLENDAEGGSRNEELDQLKIEETSDRIFRIYENKKLIQERIPDYYFIQPQTIDEEYPVPTDSGGKKDDFNCNDYCMDHYFCDPGDPLCIADCLAHCLTELSGKDHH